jgi:1,6-anhydro-N-acetylmuramate kinase
MNPQWEARQAQTTRDISGAVSRALHQMAASIAQQAREQASHDQIDVMSGWEARNKTMDSIRERRSEAFTGTRTANDDYLGVSHAVTNDFDYYWTRPDGSIARANTDTPPTTAMAGA